MSRAPLRAVIAGAVTLDETPLGTQPGGSVLYGAWALRARGVDVYAMTAMHPAETALRAAFGDARLLAQVAPSTATFENRYDPRERVRQVLRAPAPSVLPHVPGDTDLVALAPVMAELDLVAWCQAAPRRAFLSLGAQGVLRTVRGRVGPVLPACWDPPDEVLARLDACFFSEDDVRHQPGLIPWLRQSLPLLVVTHGQRGATAFAAGRTLHVPARRVPVVDPTGAGDTFHAVAAASLAEGAPLEAALEDATRAAARCVSRRAPRLRQSLAG